jgi:hypothetical protein
MALPPAPAVAIDAPATASPADQFNITISLANGYSLPITGKIDLGFTADADNPSDDPAIQFVTGGRTVTFSIPANTMTAAFPVPQLALQTGTIAGTLTLSVSMQAAGTALPTPSDLNKTITIQRAAPSIRGVKIVNTSGGVEVRVTGYSSPRALTNAKVHFSGANLQGADATFPLGDLSNAWFQSPTSTPYGSQFTLVLPFALQGSSTDIQSVSVTLSNKEGTSQSVTGNFQ